jgi:hypothetical protein
MAKAEDDNREDLVAAVSMRLIEMPSEGASLQTQTLEGKIQRGPASSRPHNYANIQ